MWTNLRIECLVEVNINKRLALTAASTYRAWISTLAAAAALRLSARASLDVTRRVVVLGGMAGFRFYIVLYCTPRVLWKKMD